MEWLFLAVSMAFALLVVNVVVPARREPFTAISFAFGWLAGELPVHLIVVEAAGTAVLAADGTLTGWPGWTALALAVASAGGLCGLAVTAHRSAAVVDAALTGATGGPIPCDPDHGDPVWARGWRLLIAVPFRFRGIKRIRNVDYWGDGNYRHKLDVLVRRDPPADNAPVLVYIHGGAWVIGDKREQGMPMMHELARRGWVCVSINYRLSPRATWPAHIVDCKRALAWVKGHISEYGGDPGFVAVSGGSAGGHLAALAALTPNVAEWQPGFEEADTSVDACIPFYGVYDMTGDPGLMGRYGPNFVKVLERTVMKTTVADNRSEFEQASPDRRVTGGAPPMFVVAGSNDTLVPREVARHFVERLRAESGSTVAYAELPMAQHAFDIMVTIRSRHTTMGVVRFLEEVRSRAGGQAGAADPDHRARDATSDVESPSF